MLSQRVDRCTLDDRAQLLVAQVELEETGNLSRAFRWFARETLKVQEEYAIRLRLGGVPIALGVLAKRSVRIALLPVHSVVHLDEVRQWQLRVGWIRPE